MGHTALLCGASDIGIIRSHAAAVDIFMFISGFLMTYHYRLREDREPWGSPSTWLKFYTRRFFRLAPVYYLILAITLIFRNNLYHAYLTTTTTFPPPWAHLLNLSPNPPAWSWGSVVTHFTFLFGFFHNIAPMVICLTGALVWRCNFIWPFRFSCYFSDASAT